MPRTRMGLYAFRLVASALRSISSRRSALVPSDAADWRFDTRYEPHISACAFTNRI